ncbi:MAG: ASKHA domain-containing protein, partial [Acidimicrobiales bacterium]
SCGVRATNGAIERVRIDPDTLDVRFKVIGQDAWSDEPEFDHSQPIPGVCGSGIIEILGEMFTTGVMDSEGVIAGGAADRSDRIVQDGRTYSFVIHSPAEGPDLCVTQNDVRAIQLAKAALRAGIDLLLEHADITSVDDIRLAGAFGAHIDPVYAVGIGLVPNGPLGPDAVASTGNSAGNGAIRMLLSQADRTEIETVVATKVTKIETATEPRFQELFVDAMAFPHRSESPLAATANGGRRRRRRANP